MLKIYSVNLSVISQHRRDFFEFILEPYSNLTGSILDLSVMAWNRKDFFERVLNYSLSSPRI